jgi:uncharacterized Ntn-hydrolase superfamily protein
MTYSIVARDPETGALGVGVQTCMFAVGAIVPWVRAGVGAVATQATAETAYGPRCLDALEAGASAREALDGAAAVDPESSVRQVAVLAADGTVAAMTGADCIDHAGHIEGDGFAVQANMIASPKVWPAMAEAFTSTTAPLPRRLLAALHAAQAAGGDARGVMSAALVVLGGEQSGIRPVDLRVDRSADPLGDLARLLTASDAYGRYRDAADHLSSGKADAALSDADAGLAMLPDEENLRFIRIRALLARGDLDAGRDELRKLLGTRPTWEIIIRSYAARGLVNLPAGTAIEQLFG